MVHLQHQLGEGGRAGGEKKRYGMSVNFGRILHRGMEFDSAHPRHIPELNDTTGGFGSSEYSAT
jgi:hypothetical protein